MICIVLRLTAHIFTPITKGRNITKTYEKIVEKYHKILDESAILLENGVSALSGEVATRDRILGMTNEELQEKLGEKDLLIFGATGFAGKNKEYPTDRLNINHKKEIELSKRFIATSWISTV